MDTQNKFIEAGQTVYVAGCIEDCGYCHQCVMAGFVGHIAAQFLASRGWYAQNQPMRCLD